VAERLFALDWSLEIEHEHAEQLAEALAPETDDHARLRAEGDRLVLEGEGSAGESLHTLDDALACLTGAVEVLDETEDETGT